MYEVRLVHRRYGLCFQSIEICDQLWLACCALHNMLLYKDGLDTNWVKGAKSNWEMSHNNDTQKYHLMLYQD